MKWYRIQALAHRHLLLTFGQPGRLFSFIYWPFVNIVVWGITSLWIQAISEDPAIPLSILTGLVLWQIVFRVNLETAKAVYEEFLNHNLVNLFSTPLTWLEWVVSLMVVGIANMIMVTFCSGLAVYFLYNINILTLGSHLILFMSLLLVSGWFIGFFICGLLIYWGLKAQDFLYSIGYMFAPFSAIFYPLLALPPSAQLVSKWLPTTYVFEAMRELLTTGSYSHSYIVSSILLNFLYLGFALLFFKVQFERSRIQGLGRLE